MLDDQDRELSNVLKGHLAAGAFKDPTQAGLATQVAAEGYASLTDEQRAAFDETIRPVVDAPVPDVDPGESGDGADPLPLQVLPPPD